MKKLLIILTLLFVYSVTFPQVAIIKTTHYAVCIDEWSDWEEADLLIVIDFEKETVKIDNSFEDVFYIRQTGEIITGINEAGEYISYKQTCYDNNGAECFLIWTKWEKVNIVSCLVSYSNIKYGYLGEFID